jgi:hypothetical protein
MVSSSTPEATATCSEQRQSCIEYYSLLSFTLFADDVALATHSEGALQRLISRFADECRELSLNINLKKTNTIGQHVSTTLKITMEKQILEVVDKFTYLGSTISNNLSLDAKHPPPWLIFQRKCGTTQC